MFDSSDEGGERRLFLHIGVSTFNLTLTGNFKDDVPKAMKIFSLKLHGPEPDTLPVGSLAKYLSQLAVLYGNSNESMHLSSIEDGCACLNIAIEDCDEKSTLENIMAASKNSGAAIRNNAYKRLIKQIDKDGYRGELFSGARRLLELPSSRLKADEELLTHTMKTTVKGRLYSVGGKDATIPVKIESTDNKIISCETTQDLAIKLGSDLFHYIEAKGEGYWSERPEGGWTLKKLNIESYSIINNESPKSIFDTLKDLDGLRAPRGKGLHTDILDSRG